MRWPRRFLTPTGRKFWGEALSVAAIALVPITLAGLAALALGVLWPPNSGSASSSSLTCSVKDTDCGDDEEVFRMSSTTNAHASTPTGSSYLYRVCCGGVTGLGTDCSGNYATVLALSGSDNAHAATTAGGSYTTKVCLSATEGTVACTYGSDCGDYECVATVSGDTNAHVADCDGTDVYTTKVCCAVTAGGPPVGGVAQLPDASGPSGSNHLALAGLAAALLVALTAGGWYARRRWLA